MADANFADALRQKLQTNTGVNGGNQHGVKPVTAPGLLAAPAAPAAAPTAPGAAPMPSAPAAPPAPAQPHHAQPAAAPAPATPDPFQGNGVQLPNGQWVDKNHPLASQAGTGASPAGGTAAAASPNPLGDVFRSALVSRLQANPTPTSIADDPVLAAQSAAFRQSSARQAARDRSAAVEAAGAQGLESSGATSSMTRKLDADRAFREGQFDAGLLGDARTQRMQELQAFLGIAGNTLSNEERNALEREMGLLDASVRREGIASQASLGAGDLALRGELGRGGLQQNLLSILLNNRTDNDRTALSAAGLELGANTNALRALLGGGV